MNYFTFASFVLFVACGTQENSYQMHESEKTANVSDFDNNSQTELGEVVQSSAIVITNAYLHIPANNLYGNRIGVIEFSIPNIAAEKIVWVKIGQNWIKASYADAEVTEVANGEALVRWLGAERGLDRFRLAAHDIVHASLPMFELAVTQNGREEKSRFKLQKAPIQGGHHEFDVPVLNPNIKIESLQIVGASLRMVLDVKKFEGGKILTIMVGADDLNSLIYEKLRAESTVNDTSFRMISEKADRQKFEVSVQLGQLRGAKIQKIETVFYSNASFVVPSIGQEDGIVGDSHAVTAILRVSK